MCNTQCVQNEYLWSVQSCTALATLAFLAATHFQLTPDPLLQKWVMAAIPAFATPNTDFEKVDSKLLSRHRAACKLLFVCFLCGCPLQHAEQDKACKLTSTCEMGFRLFVRFASDLHLLSRLNWHLISTHLLQKC